MRKNKRLITIVLIAILLPWSKPFMHNACEEGCERGMVATPEGGKAQVKGECAGLNPWGPGLQRVST